MRNLRGYRLAVLKDYLELESYKFPYPSSSWPITRAEVRKWLTLRSVNLDLTQILSATPRDIEYDGFKSWWENKLSEARDEGKTLVVVEVDRPQESDGSAIWRRHLKRLEEEEWDAGIENGVRFTTLDSLVKTVTWGDEPLDSWGDRIPRGSSAHIFLGNFFAMAPPFNPQVRSMDRPDSKSLAIENGGRLLTEQTLAEDDVANHCYVLCDGLRDNATTYIDYTPLFAEWTKIGGGITLANSVWVYSCDKAGKVCDPAEYPVLFQPQTWPVQQLRKSSQGDGHRLIVSASGFTGHCYHAIRLWVESMGATYTKNVSSRNTHLICKFEMPDYDGTQNLGVATVSLDWLYHIMQNGYAKGSEELFPPPITVTFCAMNGTETDCLIKQKTIPLFPTFEAYANAAGIPVGQCDFLLDGTAVDGREATPSSLCLEHGDKIEVWPKKNVITIKDTKGNETSYSARVTDRISKVLDEYVAKEGISMDQCSLILPDGRTIFHHDETLWTLGLKHGSTINVL